MTESTKVEGAQLGRVLGTWVGLLLLFTSFPGERKARLARLRITNKDYFVLLLIPTVLMLLAILSLKGAPPQVAHSLVPAVRIVLAYLLGILGSAIVCVRQGKGMA